MKQKSDGTTESKKIGRSREWNYHPALPIQLAPFFDRPFKPKAALQWLRGTWLKITPPVSHLFFAVLVYTCFWPALAEMEVFSVDWAMRIFTINMMAVVILASALHAYLYVFSKQEMRLKFDVRPMEKMVDSLLDIKPGTICSGLLFQVCQFGQHGLSCISTLLPKDKYQLSKVLVHRLSGASLLYSLSVSGNLFTFIGFTA